MAIILTSIFLFGLVIGSFLNVVIYRMLSGESPLRGRSKCPKCKKTIRALDNIPLLSYLILRGRCRYCGEKIAITYPVVEMITGILFVWWYLGGSLFFKLAQFPFVYIQPIFWLIVGVLLIIIFFSDLLSGLIPDILVISLSGLALIYRIILTTNGIMQTTDFWRYILSGLGASLFFLALIIITRGKGMGMGDAKLSLALGLVLGWPRILVGLFLSFILGALFSLILLAAGKKTIKQTIPFGPFLVLGTITSLIWGEWFWNLYIGYIF